MVINKMDAIQKVSSYYWTLMMTNSVDVDEFSKMRAEYSELCNSVGFDFQTELESYMNYIYSRLEKARD